MAPMLGNPRDQKIQAVLSVMGFDLGRHGVDGSIGSASIKAEKEFAKKFGIDPNDKAKTEQAILDKLKDPKFRADALEKLKDQPQIRDNVVATKWVLDAAGHPTLGMKDPATGLMTGNMDSRTKYALENTVNGNVGAAVVTAAVGAENSQTRDTILASKNIPNVNASFAGAAVGENRVVQAPEARPAPVQRLDI